MSKNLQNPRALPGLKQNEFHRMSHPLFTWKNIQYVLTNSVDSITMFIEHVSSTWNHIANATSLAKWPPSFEVGCSTAKSTWETWGIEVAREMDRKWMNFMIPPKIDMVLDVARVLEVYFMIFYSLFENVHFPICDFPWRMWMLKYVNLGLIGKSWFQLSG